MKKNKPILTTAFIMILAVAFLFIGCPTSTGSSDHYIEFNSDIVGGRIEALDSNGNPIRQASRNTLVTIKAAPNPGNMVSEMEVRDNSLMHWVGEDRVNLTTWTFRMPNHSVVIRATFGNIDTILNTEILNLESITPTWDEISRVNDLFRLLQSDGRDIPATYIDRLTDVIKETMRVANFTQWAPANYHFSSYPIDDPLYRDIDDIHIYFVMSENNNEFPPINRVPPGWVASAAVTEAPPRYGAPALRHVPLVYTIGSPSDDSDRIRSNLWLVPVTQFNIVWDQTSVGNRREFTIQAFHHPTLGPTLGRPNVVTPDGGKLNWTGDVGDAIFTRITTTGSGTGTQSYTINIGADGEGAFVKPRAVDVITGAQISSGTDINEIHGPIDFIPQSRIYRIKVSFDP